MIWLVGSKGMLGSEISKALSTSNLEYCDTDIEFDITDLKSLEQFAENKNFKWIINCAAYTAVDLAEEEEELAKELNVTGVKNLALIAKKKQLKIIHFSTDYVFDGNSSKPYNELDERNPQTVYGRSKLMGEQVLQQTMNEYFIFRISWLYGTHGSSFVSTILKLLNEENELKIINDQFGSPTYAKTLAENVVELIRTNDENFGVYHYSDEGVISWFDFANQIKKIALKNNIVERNTPVLSISSEEYTYKTRRPKYSLLDKSKIKRMLNFQINDWIDNLEDYIESL